MKTQERNKAEDKKAQAVQVVKSLDGVNLIKLNKVLDEFHNPIKERMDVQESNYMMMHLQVRT